MPSPDDPRRGRRGPEPNARSENGIDDHGEFAARRADEEPDPGEPLAQPNAVEPSPRRRAHLDRSGAAVGPLDIQAYLDARPPRRSGLRDRAEIRDYHRQRAQTRGHEALTPGADLRVTLLPLARPSSDGTFHFVPGHFAATSPEILYSPSYGPVEKYVWGYLFDHRDFDTFRKTGDVVVSTVRCTDLAACAGVCDDTIREAVHGLIAKGRLTRKLRGQGRPPVYTLPLLESGASVYPAGHNRSARRRLLALLKRAEKNPEGPDAQRLSQTLGLRIRDLLERKLAHLLFRRLARAAEDDRAEQGGDGNPCPHPVDSDAPDPDVA